MKKKNIYRETSSVVKKLSMGENSEALFLDWLKKKAESVKDTNVYESKSWLLTASTLFPGNISMKVSV